MWVHEKTSAAECEPSDVSVIAANLGRAIEGESKIMSDPVSELFGKVGRAAKIRQAVEELAVEGLIEPVRRPDGTIVRRKGRIAYRISEKGRAWLEANRPD